MDEDRKRYSRGGLGGGFRLLLRRRLVLSTTSGKSDETSRGKRLPESQVGGEFSDGDRTIVVLIILCFSRAFRSLRRVEKRRQNFQGGTYGSGGTSRSEKKKYLKYADFIKAQSHKFATHFIDIACSPINGA